jgi:pimeloyl-ACP methyl ester carboxylesterase
VPLAETPDGGRVSGGSAAASPIEVRHHGAGPPVAVLHGGPGAPGSAVSLARSLAGEFSVLEPLQRRGGSVPLTVEQHVSDLVAAVGTPMPIIGWSWGAMLGLSFAAIHPDRLRALVVVGCGTYDERSRALYREAVARRLGPEGSARMAQLGARLDAAPAAEKDGVFAEMGRLAGAADAWEPIGDATGDLPADAAGHAETWGDVLRLQESGIEPARFGAIRVPVLMIHGSEDPHPGAATRDVLAAFVPQVEYVEIPGCGHAPWLERTGREPFFAMLLPWLRRQAGSD